MKISIPRLFELLFPLLVCSLYLPPVFYSLFTAALTVLAGVALGQGYRINLRQPILWFVPGFFLIHAGGLVLGGSEWAALKGLQIKLSFLLLPFILGVFQPLLTRSFLRKLIAAFFYSSLIFCIVLFLISTNNLLEDYQNLSAAGEQDKLQWFRYFYSSILTHGYIHRSYLGLMIGAALISSPFVLPIHRLKRFFFMLGAAFLLVVLIFLQSRMVLLALAACLFLYAVIHIIQTKSTRGAIYLGFGVLAISVLGYFFADSPYNRFRDTAVTEYDITNPDEDYTGTTIRMAIWENNLELVRNNPIFGTGYGKLNEERLAIYTKNDFKVGLRSNYNSHNQYLETQIVAGIPGTILLFGIFLTIGRIAFNRGDTHLFILALFLFLNMLTEAMFERQLAIGLFCTYILAMAIGEKVGFNSR